MNAFYGIFGEDLSTATRLLNFLSSWSPRILFGYTALCSTVYTHTSNELFRKHIIKKTRIGEKIKVENSSKEKLVNDG